MTTIQGGELFELGTILSKFVIIPILDIRAVPLIMRPLSWVWVEGIGKI